MYSHTKNKNKKFIIKNILSYYSFLVTTLFVYFLKNLSF